MLLPAYHGVNYQWIYILQFATLIGERIRELPIKSHQFSIGSFFFVTRTWIINLEVLFLAEVLGKKPTSWRFKNCCLAVSERFLASHLVFFSHPESSFQICLQTLARNIVLATGSHLGNLRKIKHYCNEAIFLLVRMQKMKKPFNDKSLRRRHTSHVYSVIMNANWRVFVAEKK